MCWPAAFEQLSKVTSIVHFSRHSMHPKGCTGMQDMPCLHHAMHSRQVSKPSSIWESLKGSTRRYAAGRQPLHAPDMNAAYRAEQALPLSQRAGTRKYLHV